MSLITPEYYVAFMPSNTLFRLVEKQGFNHCFIFFPYDGDIDTAKYVCIAEHNHSFTNLGFVEKEVMLRYIKKGTYLKVEAKRSSLGSFLWWIPKPHTCVTIVKDILGISAPFVWTPYQLYKLIRKKKWDL